MHRIDEFDAYMTIPESLTPSGSKGLPCLE